MRLMRLGWRLEFHMAKDRFGIILVSTAEEANSEQWKTFHDVKGTFDVANRFVLSIIKYIVFLCM